MTELSRLIDRLSSAKNLGGFPGDQPSSVEELAAMMNRALDELTPEINADPEKRQFRHFEDTFRGADALREAMTSKEPS